MKIAAIFILLIFIISGCEEYENHNYLGKGPAIAKKYHIEIEKLNKELLKIRDTEKAQKKILEISNLKIEADEELKNFFKSSEKSFLIPFIQEVNKELFEIQTIEIENISYNQIDISASFISLADTRNSLFCYMIFVDKEGNELPGWIVMISQTNISAGNSYSFSGTYKGLHNLVNAANLVVMSAKDFQNSTSFNN